MEGIVSVSYLREILQANYSTFPVLNSSGNIVGMMPKSFIIVLLENHHFIDINKLTANQLSRVKGVFKKGVTQALDLPTEESRHSSTAEDFEQRVSMKIDAMVSKDVGEIDVLETGRDSYTIPPVNQSVDNHSISSALMRRNEDISARQS